MKLLFKIILFFLCFTNLKAQLLYYQDTYKGGISVDGRSYFGKFYAAADSISFQNSVPAGSFIKKAFLISNRGGWLILTQQKDNPVKMIFNNHSITFDSSDIVTNLFHCDYTNPSVSLWMAAKDVTAYTQSNNNTLLTPCQTCLGTDTVAHYVYNGFLLVILYENNTMPPVNAAVFLNNKTYSGSMTHTFNNLNPINTTNDVGLSVWVNDVPDLSHYWPIDFILNTSLGIFNLDSIYAPYHAPNENTLPGSFYYENNTLHGLVDDLPNTTFDSTDALANIKSYVSNNTTNFSINTTENTSPLCIDVIYSFIYTYSTPCPPRTNNDTVKTYNLCKGQGQSVQLIANNGLMASSFSWYAMDSSLNNYNIQNPIASPTASANYIVLVDSFGCKHTEHFKVNVYNLPINLAVVAPDSCAEQKGSITAGHSTDNLAPYTYSIGGALQSSPNFSNLSAGIYTLTTTNSIGCKYKQALNLSNINPVHASISSSSHVGFAPFTTNLTNYSTGSTSYTWYIDGNIYNTKNLSYTFNSSGTYTVLMVADYDNNALCKDTAYQTVFVKEPPTDSLNITVPNIFSPNADGINDAWQITVSSYQYTVNSYSCVIYDRWGIKVFETSNISEAWSGKTTSGLPCSAGTYFYIIKLTATNSKGVGEDKDFKGYLELVR
jgi:gliding motility-associated-like protein